MSYRKGHGNSGDTYKRYTTDPAVCVGHCAPERGKVIYLSRKTAKVAARKTPPGGGGALRPYPCPHADHWHVGHIPAAVRQGEITKEQWLARRRPAGGAA